MGGGSVWKRKRNEEGGGGKELLGHWRRGRDQVEKRTLLESVRVTVSRGRRRSAAA